MDRLTVSEDKRSGKLTEECLYPVDDAEREVGVMLVNDEHLFHQRPYIVQRPFSG